MSTHSINPNHSLLKTVEKGTEQQLLQLLQNAEVSVGNLAGRLITVQGYNGHITFSQFFSRVEEIYQATVKPMQDRQKQYEKDSTSRLTTMPFRAFRLNNVNNLLNLALLPISLPLKIIGDGRCYAMTNYPDVSEDEEKNISAILEWRRQIDIEFDRLVNSSQNEIDALAESSWKGKVVKYWDYFLDTKISCKNPHLYDQNILDNMVKSRESKKTTISGSIRSLISSNFFASS